MTPEELANLAVESDTYSSLNNVSGIINVCLVILTALVTICTFYFGNKASDSKEKIANQKIAEANTKAAVANKQAKEASLNAELAKIASTSAILAATEAKNKQIELAIELEKEKQRLNESNIMRAKAEIALNDKIEEDRIKSMPRMLTSEQKQQLKNLLKAHYNPMQKIRIITIIGDEEAKKYALEYETIFTSFNWTNGDGIEQVIYSNNPCGMFLFVKKDQPVIPSTVSLLLNILKQIGIEVILADNPNMKENQVELLIGHKL